MFSELALIARKVAPAILRYTVLRIKLEEWEREVLFKGPTTPSTGTSTSTTTTTPNGSSGPFSGPLFSSHLLNERVRSPVPDQRFVGAFSPATAQVANSIMAMLAWSAKKKARPFVKFYKLYVPTLVGGDEEGNDGRGQEEPAAKRARNEEAEETPKTTTKSGENSATAVNSATTPRPSLVPSPSPSSPGQCLLGSRSSPSSAALAQQLQASAQLIRQSNAKKRLLSSPPSSSPPPLHQVFVIAVEPQSEHLPTPPPIFLADPNFGHGSIFAEPSELTTLETARAGFSIQYRNGWPMLQFAEGHPLKEEMKKAVYQYYFQQKK
ncbi:hypothetical protein TYRP_020321 [Tyrophagus putrescentiae]|nr:hypothetical protein TYRP_020321 [Tyrophagus putrescentiae]